MRLFLKSLQAPKRGTHVSTACYPLVHSGAPHKTVLELDVVLRILPNAGIVEQRVTVEELVLKGQGCSGATVAEALTRLEGWCRRVGEVLEHKASSDSFLSIPVQEVHPDAKRKEQS